MDDASIWALETELWTGGEIVYRRSVDDHCLMVVPAEPFILSAEQAIAAVAAAPRWTEVDLTERRLARPQGGLIVLAYKAEASRGNGTYTAACTSTYARLSAGEWRLVQHQQTPLPKA